MAPNESRFMRWASSLGGQRNISISWPITVVIRTGISRATGRVEWMVLALTCAAVCFWLWESLWRVILASSCERAASREVSCIWCAK